MPDNIEEKVGLQFCYWKINDKLHQPEIAGSYVMNINDTHEFFVNEKCIGGKTRNPQSTITQARWAYIYQVFFSSIQHKPESEITKNLWGNLSGGPEEISKYALGTSYKQGSNLAFRPSGESYYYGFKQRIELFSQSPGTGFFFFVIPFTDPKICYAYFKGSEDIKRYGENANLTVMFHGYNFDENFRYKAKVYLLESSEAIGLTETEQFEDKNLWEAPVEKNLDAHDSNTDSNIYIRHNFNINVEWKKNQEGTKEFTVAVEVYRAPYSGRNSEKWERFHHRNFLTEPTSDLVSYDTELLTLEDVDKKDSISSRFMVSEELMDDYLFRIEEEKKNMIQYIGDIEYTKREFDPCGYSKITIQEKGDTQRQPLVIFDETQPASEIDKTEQIFAIITGDERKNITITLDGLQTKNEFCQGLLLDDEQKHTQHKNVFQVDKVYSALNNGDSRQIDNTHQDQLKKAGITPNGTETDTDVIKTNNVYNPTIVQQWQDRIDYKIESDKEITLKLRYLYNKTAFEKLQGSNKTVNNAVNLLWVFRYFWFTDKIAQKYFLPISTCRYPNQIAKINVYPDIEWEVSFLITTGETHTLAGGKKDDVTNYPARQNFKFSDRFKLTSEYKGFSFATDISVKVNGDIHKLGFDKIENIIKKLADLKEFLDKFNSSNSTNASAGGFTEYFTFKLVSPNIALAFKWNLGHVVENEHNYKAVTMLNGSLKLAPLIGINFEVDLFIITDNIKVYGIGPITKFIRKSIEWVTETDIFVLAYVNVELQGEFTLVYNSINGFDEKKSNRKAILSIPFGVKGGIKSNEENVIILPTGEKMEKFNAEISINSGIDITEELGTDNIGPYKKNSYIFKGLNVKVVIVENVFSRNKISVIPKIDETFEVLKEDKICPDNIEYLNNN